MFLNILSRSSLRQSGCYRDQEFPSRNGEAAVVLITGASPGLAGQPPIC